MGPVLLYVAVDSRSRGHSEAESSRPAQGVINIGLACCGRVGAAFLLRCPVWRSHWHLSRDYIQVYE